MKKVPIKKAVSRVKRTELNPVTLMEPARDPSGRLPTRKVEEFVPPIQAKVVSLNGIVKPSERAKVNRVAKVDSSSTTRKSKDDKIDRLLDFL